ncbi:MAG: PRTRC system ThiF family protein [Gemmatimonadaceae bacterium]|nr:PRTRC system ThiF family protein [Gemmatimonadaceae bacterium]
MATFCIPATLASAGRPLRVVLVGVGGTGASVLGGLPALDLSLRAFGHPGLEVTVYDPDVVSEANCARQPFAVSEVGAPKAATLVTRINAFYGTRWVAKSEAVTDTTDFQGVDVLIGAVDSRAARRAIHRSLGLAHGARLWLDFGNRSDAGQFLLGERRGTLPTVADAYPELVDPSLDDPAMPSCSAREALLTQGAFVNQALAQLGLAMLARLFREGALTYHGMHLDFATGRAVPIPVPEPARRRKSRPTARRSRLPQP